MRIVGRLKQLTWHSGGIPAEKVIILAEHIEFQPAKKPEEIKEPDHVPGEIYTRSSNIDELEEASQTVTTEIPAEEPAAQIPEIAQDDVPQCEMEDEENPETKGETDDGEIFLDEDLGGNAAGY